MKVLRLFLCLLLTLRQTQASAVMAATGRACSLYVWDAPSALLAKWCQHLLKDCIYEGRGGHKFVRIPPGSILQLLYPNNYSTDRCLLCGGTFRDHLTLWWGKHLYTPFDRLLDRTLEEARVVEDVKRGSKRKRRAVVEEKDPQYKFYAPYCRLLGASQAHESWVPLSLGSDTYYLRPLPPTTSRIFRLVTGVTLFSVVNLR